MRGVLVRRDFETSLLSPADLPAYTDLSATALHMRAALPLARALWPQLIQALLAVWADVVVVKAEESKEESREGEEKKPEQQQPAQLPSLLVCGRVTLRQSVAIPQPGAQGADEGGATGAAGAGGDEATMDPRKRRKKTAGGETAARAAAAEQQRGPSEQECVILEWSSGTVDDLIADSVAAIACQCCVAPWAVLQQPRHAHEHAEEEAHSHEPRALRPEAGRIVERALAGHFGEAAVSAGGKEGEPLAVTVGGEARVLLWQSSGRWEVEAGANEALAAEARAVVERLFARGLLTPIKANIL